MSIVLEVVVGPDKGKTFSIEQGQKLDIGRSPAMAISLPQDRHMSRRHFQIEYDGTTCAVTDLASSNGTFINKNRIADSLARPGDYIAAGDSVFLVHGPAAGQAPGAPPPFKDTNIGERPQLGVAFTAEKDHLAEAAVVMDKSGAKAPLPNIINTTSFPATAMFWKDADGAAKLSVIVKATFTLDENQQPAIADEQWPLLTADQHYEDDPEKPVRFETDVVPFKPRADIVLIGNAHSPDDKPVRSLDVGLRVGGTSKIIKVIGDRYWVAAPGEKAATVTEPKPFTSMPISYERAYGGVDEAASARFEHNPVGMGFIAQYADNAIDGRQLPNLEDSRDLISAWQSRPKPAAFGFFGRSWIPRINHAGDQSGQDPAAGADKGVPSVQAGSFAFYNGAHPDLQLDGYLDGDEPVELVHLSKIPRIKFLLPNIKPRIVIRTRSAKQFMDESADDLDAKTVPGGALFGDSCKAVLDTLVLVPDENTFYQVFRAVYNIPNNDPGEIDNIVIT